jgi:hypothetical protein
MVCEIKVSATPRFPQIATGKYDESAGSKPENNSFSTSVHISMDMTTRSCGVALMAENTIFCN